MDANQCVISGTVQRTPRLSETHRGTKVLDFVVLNNNPVKNQETDKWEDQTTLIECVVYGPYAAVAAKQIQRGSYVCVTGRLVVSSWTKGTERRHRIQVNVDRLIDAACEVAR